MRRGTNIEQDSRFKDKTRKMLEESKWPDKYDIVIELKKINMKALKKWIEKRISIILGHHDDITSGTVISLLEENLENQQRPNAKKIHVAMSGLLSEKTLTFVSELWDHMDEAQKAKSKISKTIVEEKQKQVENEKKQLKKIQDKKEIIKSYKFNEIIRRYGPRQRTPSAERKRKERTQAHLQHQKIHKPQERSQSIGSPRNRRRNRSRDQRPRRHKQKRSYRLRSRESSQKRERIRLRERSREKKLKRSSSPRNRRKEIKKKRRSMENMSSSSSSPYKVKIQQNISSSSSSSSSSQVVSSSSSLSSRRSESSNSNFKSH